MMANTHAANVAKPPVAGAAVDGGVADPLAFVKDTYAAYAKGNVAPPPIVAEAVYSPRLQAAFAKDLKDAGGEMGRLDFDYWTAAQDYELGAVTVTQERATADKREIVARFTNMDTPTVNHFDFVRHGDRWMLDEVRSDPNAANDSSGWTLSKILTGI
jgi:hypothetical protein